MTKHICPDCGERILEYCLDSDPPKYELRCEGCGYQHRQEEPHTPQARAITKEQVEAWQQQQAELEQQAEKEFAEKLMAFCDEHGFDLVAIPSLTPDGRVAAGIGVRRKNS